MQQESKQFIFTVLIIHFLIDLEEKKKRKENVKQTNKKVTSCT